MEAVIFDRINRKTINKAKIDYKIVDALDELFNRFEYGFELLKFIGELKNDVFKISKVYFNDDFEISKDEIKDAFENLDSEFKKLIKI